MMLASTNNTKELVWEVVLQDELVCLMSPEHPLADVELTVEHYLNSQHIGIAESELSRLILSRH